MKLIKLDEFQLNDSASNAISSFRLQKGDRPINQFWPKVDSEKEQAVQQICEYTIKSGNACRPFHQFPTKLRLLIETRLNQFIRGVKREITALAPSVSFRFSPT